MTTTLRQHFAWQDFFKEAPAMTTLKKGSYVQVQVLGLPHSSKTDNVFTYRLHADVVEHAEVRVPAPPWSERVHGRETLFGYVLGLSTPADLHDLDDHEIRDTLPLYDAESHAEGFTNGRVATTVSVLREQAAAFLEAHRGLTAAADLLERTKR